MEEQEEGLEGRKNGRRKDKTQEAMEERKRGRRKEGMKKDRICCYKDMFKTVKYINISR